MNQVNLCGSEGIAVQPPGEGKGDFTCPQSRLPGGPARGAPLPIPLLSAGLGGLLLPLEYSSSFQAVFNGVERLSVCSYLVLAL